MTILHTVARTLIAHLPRLFQTHDEAILVRTHNISSCYRKNREDMLILPPDLVL